MTRILFGIAFAIGAIVIIWIGSLFMGVDKLGLSVTVLIGIVYVIGTGELLLFRQTIHSLQVCLDTVSEKVEDLNQWLGTLPQSLQNQVHLRVKGERNTLPTPVVTPYLVGLLVMLGLLGTFVGMVATLKGAVVALEGNTELEAIRAGLTAPMEGLGLAFGTSVAGVAASAMLGLLSTISRYERLQTSQLLDSKIAAYLSHFSISQQQVKAYQSMQEQAESLPMVLDKLTTLAVNIESMGERLSENLISNQSSFQSTVIDQYQGLADSVDQSLKKSLKESADILSSSIEPLATQTMKHVSDSVLSTQAHLNDSIEQQMQANEKNTQNYLSQMHKTIEVSLNKQDESFDGLVMTMNKTAESTHDQLLKRSQTLLDKFDKSTKEWTVLQKDSIQQISHAIHKELSKLKDADEKHNLVTIERLGDLQSVVTDHLLKLGNGLEEPMTRLIETASKTPEAAADVIEKLRDQMSSNLERDNELLSERAEFMQKLDMLSQTLETNALKQADTIETLIKSSNETLSHASLQFGEQINTEASKLSSVAEHFASSSADMASLAEGFEAAVLQFSDANNALIERLNSIETALTDSNNRSDEQLAYYVAQAREIIDHNLLSHQQIITALNAKKPQQLSVEEGR